MAEGNCKFRYKQTVKIIAPGFLQGCFGQITKHVYKYTGKYRIENKTDQGGLYRVSVPEEPLDECNHEHFYLVVIDKDMSREFKEFELEAFVEGSLRSKFQTGDWAIK